MEQRPWWRGAVLYQVYPRSFACADGDGVGDLPGLISRLDHIAGLGVDAIWVCPFYASPQRDFGYDVADHVAVDPAMGSLTDVDRLIAAAHARGLKVLFDLVAGHTSDRHPWFQAACRDPAAPTADWYVWADPRPDGTPPNNWLSVFGGSAWTWEPRRRQFFLHHFLAAQPSLNLHNPAVVEALLSVAQFWLERGCDGFRIDAVDFLAHDPALRDNPAAPPLPGGTPAKLFGLQEHQHDMLHPAGTAFLRKLRTLLDTYGAVALGEVSSQPGVHDRIAGYTAAGGPLHTAYALGPLRNGFDHAMLERLFESAVATIAAGGWPCWSFSNHDIARAATRWGPPSGANPAAARCLLALLLSLPGTASLYQGEELGLPEADLPEAALRDPFGLAYWPEYRGRDGSRTPIPWAAAAHASGFTSGTPWLPIPAEHVALSVDVQATARGSTLAFCRRWLARRRAEPALRCGTAVSLGLPAPLFGVRRKGARHAYDLVFNLSGEASSLPAALRAAVPSDGSHKLTLLPGWGAAMFDANETSRLAA